MLCTEDVLHLQQPPAMPPASVSAVLDVVLHRMGCIGGVLAAGVAAPLTAAAQASNAASPHLSQRTGTFVQRWAVSHSLLPPMLQAG